MVRRYVNLDTNEVKRQHAQASPVDRLAIGPKVTVLLPWRVADRLEELAWRARTTVEELVRRGAAELVERSREARWSSLRAQPNDRSRGRAGSPLTQLEEMTP